MDAFAFAARRFRTRAANSSRLSCCWYTTVEGVVMAVSSPAPCPYEYSMGEEYVMVGARQSSAASRKLSSHCCARDASSSLDASPRAEVFDPVAHDILPLADRAPRGALRHVVGCFRVGRVGRWAHALPIEGRPADEEEVVTFICDWLRAPAGWGALAAPPRASIIFVAAMCTRRMLSFASWASSSLSEVPSDLQPFT